MFQTPLGGPKSLRKCGFVSKKTQPLCMAQVVEHPKHLECGYIIDRNNEQSLVWTPKWRSDPNPKWWYDKSSIKPAGGLELLSPDSPYPPGSGPSPSISKMASLQVTSPWAPSLINSGRIMSRMEIDWHLNDVRFFSSGMLYFNPILHSTSISLSVVLRSTSSALPEKNTKNPEPSPLKSSPRPARVPATTSRHLKPSLAAALIYGCTKCTWFGNLGVQGKMS